MIKLSKESLLLIEKKAKEWKISEQKALDYMIDSFSLSTSEERLKQTKEYNRVTKEYFSSHFEVAPMVAWRKGYLFGWNHFQYRKINNPFKNAGYIEKIA